MALHTPPTKTPDPQGDQGTDAPKIVRDYMFRQYWSLKWWLITLVSFMSIYTISFDRWIPGIGLTGFLPFAAVMLGILAGGTILSTEFLKAIRAKDLGHDFDWTSVRYAAWGMIAGNMILLYWTIIMAYISWFTDDPLSTWIQ